MPRRRLPTHGAMPLVQMRQDETRLRRIVGCGMPMRTLYPLGAVWRNYEAAHRRTEEADARRPRGEHHPADAIGAAVKVVRILIGQEAEELQDAPAPSPAVLLGKPGRTVRAEALTAEHRKGIARKGAAKRWGMNG